MYGIKQDMVGNEDFPDVIDFYTPGAGGSRRSGMKGTEYSRHHPHQLLVEKTERNTETIGLLILHRFTFLKSAIDLMLIPNTPLSKPV